MSNEENESGLDGENKEKVSRIATDIIEPALQKALANARKEGSDQEVISALANCYAGLLVDLMGRKAAATFLQGHAVHLASLEEHPLNS
jgi:hypothetical protein